MPDSEKYLLLNLKDEQSKKVAESIANKTARKILDYLSTKEEAGAEEIAKSLSLPISTIDYNVKNLKKAGLIETKHFEWSSRGKRIILYKLAKKLIIIAPKSAILKEELKKIIPLILGIGVISIFVEYLTKPGLRLAAVQESAKLSQDSEALFASSIAQESIPEVVNNHYGIWLFVIALIIIIIYLLVKLKKKKY